MNRLARLAEHTQVGTPATSRRFPSPPLLALSWTSLALAACVGSLGDPGAAEDPGGAQAPRPPRPPVSCDGDQPSAVVAPLARLSSTEYARTLEALFGPELVAEVASSLEIIPVDTAEVEDDFSRTDQRLSPAHVRGYFQVADAIAQRVAGDAGLRAAFVGECARARVDDSCLEGFVPDFLRRAFRHEPSPEEVERVLGSARDQTGADKVHAALFVSLMAPDFLYKLENRGQARDAYTLELTAFELAARLAYHFWEAPPDDELLTAAGSGDLLTESGYQQQVERMARDPRTEETILRFFDEWLHLKTAPYTSSPRLEALRDGIDTAGLHEAMEAEVHAMLRYHLAQGGVWTDVLTSNLSFAEDPRLAAIYGVEAWDGENAPPELPAGERSGILTRAALLATSDGSTNPFRRGATLRRSVLCDGIAPPPNDLPADALQPPEPVPGATTRQRFEQKVADEPCATCHALFSDVGYALEAYDGLGRFRAMERLITTGGEDHGTAPIDTVATVYIDSREEDPVSGPVEMSERIAASPKANRCFATRYFHYTYRRTETQAADRCAIESLTERLDEGMPMREALRAIALDETFRLRELED